MAKSIEQAAAHGRGAEASDRRPLLVQGVHGVVAHLERQRKDGRTLVHPSWKWLDLIGDKDCAYLALHTAIGWIESGEHEGLSVQSAAAQIWHALSREVTMRELERIACTYTESTPLTREAFITDKRLKRRADRGTASPESLVRRANEVLLKVDDRDRGLLADLEAASDGVEGQQVGQRLLDAILNGTTWFEIATIPNGRRKRVVFRAQSPILEWIAKRGNRLAELKPIRTALVAPPVPWNAGQAYGGGYHGPLRSVTPLIRRTSRDHLRRTVTEAKPMLTDSLNALQRVPYRINAKVLEHMTHLWKVGGGRVADFPRSIPQPKPLPPEGYTREAMDEPALAYRKAIGAYKDDERLRLVRAAIMARLLGDALDLAGEERFYYAWSLDFRGRCYALSDLLQPQGPDTCRALLQLADGKALGPSGWDALLVYAASCLDKLPDGRKLSRMTLGDRRKAITSLLPRITAIAEDPLGDSLWMTADKPWQCLAAFLEIAAAHQSGYVYSYVSHLICYIDGTCNGLQHWAALLRDPDTAAAVNVSPTEAPADVYSAVADCVHLRVRDDALDPVAAPSAVPWLTSGLIDRSLTKRPVMTSVYGSSAYGFGEQIREWMLEKATAGDVRFEAFRSPLDKGLKFGATSRYMAECIDGALSETLGGAVRGMAWAQSVARQMVKHGQPLQWHAPVTHMPVVQPYRRMRDVRIRSILRHGARLVRLQVPDPKNAPDSFRHGNGAAPNLIHSFDAATVHVLAATECADALALVPVHDAFGTHAADVAQMSRHARAAFVRVHTEGTLDTLAADMAPHCAEGTMPSPPTRGSLDITTAQHSVYLFS